MTSEADLSRIARLQAVVNALVHHTKWDGADDFATHYGFGTECSKDGCTYCDVGAELEELEPQDRFWPKEIPR